MDISVVIVSYNVSSFLDLALSTAIESAKGLKAEIFVVDNASSDNSVEMVRNKYPGVNLIENKSNVGFARANNLAIAKCSGRYVLLLNPDTVVGKDTFRVMVDFLDSHPETGAAGCRVINPDGTLQLACRRGFPTPGVAFWRLTGISGLFPRSKTFGAYNMTYLDPDHLAEVDAVSGSFMMLRKSVLDNIGYLDEDYFMYGEDLDLCWRIKQDGWKIHYVPYTEIIHFKGESTKKIPALKSIRDFYFAMEIFVKKHCSDKKRFTIPLNVLLAAIYFRMGWVYLKNTVKKAGHPFLDLALLNISIILGMVVRFGLSLEGLPQYSNMEWATIFIVYSGLYIGVFYFLGMYHRYRYAPQMAVFGVFAGFLFNVFLINFLKMYNFSRLLSFYSWGFNTILISGWRFIYKKLNSGKDLDSYRTLVIGSVQQAADLKNSLAHKDIRYNIIGCVDNSPDIQKGLRQNGVHVLGFLEELDNLVKTYDIDTIMMVGLDLPFSKILGVRRPFGMPKLNYKVVPELKAAHDGIQKGDLTMIEIRPGEFLQRIRSI